MLKSKILHSNYLEQDGGMTDKDEEVDEITSRISQKEKVVDKQFQLTEDIYHKSEPTGGLTPIPDRPPTPLTRTPHPVNYNNRKRRGHRLRLEL